MTFTPRFFPALEQFDQSVPSKDAHCLSDFQHLELMVASEQVRDNTGNLPDSRRNASKAPFREDQHGLWFISLCWSYQRIF